MKQLHRLISGVFGEFARSVGKGMLAMMAPLSATGQTFTDVTTAAGINHVQASVTNVAGLPVS